MFFVDGLYPEKLRHAPPAWTGALKSREASALLVLVLLILVYSECSRRWVVVDKELSNIINWGGFLLMGPGNRKVGSSICPKEQ